VNRETKRMLQRQGAINADGTPTRETRTPVSRDPKEVRPSPREFISQVRAELKKVIWPTRPEIKNYTAVVMFTLLLMTALTFVFDWLSSKGIQSIYFR
jgi:preprotein translocase subunit SecE